MNPDDGSLVFPPTLREAAHEIIKKNEDIKAGRLVPDRDMDELTLALGNSKHPGCCRGYGVVPWKFAFKGSADTYRSRKRRREREEGRWREMMEQRLKDQEDRMNAEIERVATAVAQITPAGALPQAPVYPVISPSARKSSCASTEAPEEQRAGNQEEVQVEDNERYPVDELCQRTACELHKPIGNITMTV